jgi:hypothetical protein
METVEKIQQTQGEPENAQAVVVRPTYLAPFDKLKAAIEAYKAENKKQVFDYATPAGEKAARSHCYKLRLIKGQNIAIHKEAKADIVVTGKIMDKEKRDIDAAVDEMVDYHMKPINAIKEERDKAAKAIKDAEADALRVAENRRQMQITANEDAAKKVLEDANAEAERIAEHNKAETAKVNAAAAAAQKTIDDKYAAAEKKLADEREVLAAARRELEADKAAEAEKQAALAAQAENAAKVAAAAIQKVKDDAKAAADAIKAEAAAAEQAVIAAGIKAKEDEEKLAKIAEEEKAEQAHVDEIEAEALRGLFLILQDANASKAVLKAIDNGLIPNVSITY